MFVISNVTKMNDRLERNIGDEPEKEESIKAHKSCASQKKVAALLQLHVAHENEAVALHIEITEMSRVVYESWIREL